MKKISTKTNGELIVNSLVGQIGIVEIEEHIIANDDSWTGKTVIWDLSEWDSVIVKGEEIRKFANSMAARSPNRKGTIDVIIATKPLQYGLARMLETFAEFERMGVTIRLCQSFEEAYRILSEANLK